MAAEALNLCGQDFGPYQKLRSKSGWWFGTQINSVGKLITPTHPIFFRGVGPTANQDI